MLAPNECRDFFGSLARAYAQFSVFLHMIRILFRVCVKDAALSAKLLEG
jgi:hypothetical protein